MNIEKITHGAWQEAYCLQFGKVEMIVVTEIGPRIISLRWNGGPNILFEDATGTVGVGDWRIRGGHRLWIGPETVSTYHADNFPCEVETHPNRLRITAPPELSGMQKILEIATGPAGSIELRHIVRNVGGLLQTGSIWTLTCVVPAGRILIPWGSRGSTWDTKMVRYWRGWGAQSRTEIASPQWKPMNDIFLVEPTGEEGKIGVYTEEGWLALLRPDATFIKSFSVNPLAPYPDGGCNVEIYTNGLFNEMEALSPTGEFLPGRESIHIERWLLTDQVFEPIDWPRIEALTQTFRP